MYHFGQGRRFTEIYNVYGGKKRNERRYRNHDRWEDTDEYWASQENAATFTESMIFDVSIDGSTKDQSFRPFPLHEVIRVVERHLLDSNGNPRADLLPKVDSEG